MTNSGVSIEHAVGGLRQHGRGWALGHRPALDGLRGLAILLVVGNHAGIPLLVNAGQVGVTLFFVLSGFLITSILLAEHQNAGSFSFARFYARRALRLLPALFAMLLVAVPLLTWTTQYTGPATALPVLLYVENWAQVAVSTATPIVGHAWSLSVEEQFYLIWPIVLLVMLKLIPNRRWLAVVLLAAAAIFAIERALLWAPTREAFYRTIYGSDTRADALLLGCGLAIGFHVRPFLPRRPWLVAAVAALTVSTVVPSVGFLAVVGLPLVACGAAVLTARGASSHDDLLERRPLVWTGTISYGLYLWHVPALHVARLLIPDPGGAALVGVATAFALAFASRRWIEEPALRFKARFTARAAGVPPTYSLVEVPGEVAQQ